MQIVAGNLKEGRTSCRNIKGGISDNDIKNEGHESDKKNLLQKVGIAGKEKREAKGAAKSTSE